MEEHATTTNQVVVYLVWTTVGILIVVAMMGYILGDVPLNKMLIISAMLAGIGLIVSLFYFFNKRAHDKVLKEVKALRAMDNRNHH